MTKGRSTYPTADTYTTAQPQTLLTSVWLKFVQIFDSCLPSTIWCLPTCNLWECTKHKMNSAHGPMGQRNLQQASPQRLRRILGRLEWAYVMFMIFTNLCRWNVEQTHTCPCLMYSLCWNKQDDRSMDASVRWIFHMKYFLLQSKFYLEDMLTTFQLNSTLTTFSLHGIWKRKYHIIYTFPIKTYWKDIQYSLKNWNTIFFLQCIAVDSNIRAQMCKKWFNLHMLPLCILYRNS